MSLKKQGHFLPWPGKLGLINMNTFLVESCRMQRSGCSAARRSSSRATAPTLSGWRFSRSLIFHHSFFVKFKPNNVNINELMYGTTLGTRYLWSRTWSDPEFGQVVFGSGSETGYDLFDLKTCIIFTNFYYIGRLSETYLVKKV
jgi:hypothetical protein